MRPESPVPTPQSPVPGPLSRYQVIFLVSIALLILYLALCIGSMANASIDDCIDATCRITAGDGSRGTGCCFERSDGYVYVLTCAHVVGNSPTVQCEFWCAGHVSRPLAGRVVRRSQGADAAMVAVPESAFDGVLPKIVPVAPRDYAVRPGETLTSVGCARGTWSTGWKGHALGYSGNDLYFTPTPANGRSGSAIFDAQGRVIVGLLRARTGDDRSGIATSVRALYAAWAGPSGQSEIRNLKSEITQCPGGTCPTEGWRYELLPTPQYRQYEEGRGEAYNQGRRDAWPTLPPSTPPAATPSVDLTPIGQKLDRIGDGQEKITELLIEMRSEKTPPPPAPAEDPAVEAVAEVKAEVEQTKQQNSQLREAVNALIGDRETLQERFEARLAKVKEELGEDASKVDVARAYVKDLAAEKLGSGEVGLTIGKLATGALGLSGPLALAIGGGLWLVSRRIGRKLEDGEPLLVQRLVDRIGEKIDNLKERIPSGKDNAG